MNCKEYLLKVFLSIGVCDLKTIKKDQKFYNLNRLSSIVCLFVGVKGYIIVLFPDYIFYLIELYIFEGSIQRCLHICSSLIHLACYYSFTYYGNLDDEKLGHLNFLFISDIQKFCEYYDIESNATIKFIEIIDFFRKLFCFLIHCFKLSFFILIFRCLIIGYFKIKFIYWIFFSLPLAIFTFFQYCTITNFTLTAYFLFMISMRFLVLRAQSISKIILNKFQNKQQNSSTNQRLKTKLKSIKIIKSIENIVKQFTEINSIFSNMISLVYVNCILGTFLFPSFLFFPFPIYMKVIIMFLYLIAVIFINFSIAISNERFISEFKILESTMHSVMPKLKEIRLKLAFNNFLILSNRNKFISFTYLNSFNYSSNSLIEFVMHSFAMLFMIYQAINLKSTIK